MIWTHCGKAIPLEMYHGVPPGWHAVEMLAEHARLGGWYELGGPEATEPGAPNWLPQRRAWLQYRQTLRRIAEGVRAQDAACAELAVRYIELRYIGSYSGYVRSLLSRSLKHASLLLEQRQRLHRHFSGLLLDGEHTVEFRDYLKLWRLIVTEAQRSELRWQLGSARGEAAVAWLAENL